MSAVIGLQNVSKIYGFGDATTVALDEVSLEVDLPSGSSVLKGAPLQIQILRGRVFSRTMGSSLTDL